MDTSKIIKGVVNSGRYTVTAPIIKEDYGLYLQIEGVELPQTYEVDFSNSESNGTSVTMIGNADGVLIPRQFIDTGKDIFAFLYWVGEDYGKTVYKFRIPNKLRPDRTEETPTPEEQSVIDQTISALNDAVESAQEAQEAIEDMSVSAQTLAEGESATVTKTESDGVVHLTFGIPTGATGAQGERGEKGDTGATGAQGIQGAKGDTGADGYSPTVTITPITGGHRITITDADGEHSADVMDGTGSVDDVQINGQSIVEDGVANVPIAGADRLGVVGKPSNSFGILINASGQIYTYSATDSDIKNGTSPYRPLNAPKQHQSVFYGLAKAAGDTTQSQSSNAVGNYTEEAKAKIKKMIGANDEYELVGTLTLDADNRFWDVSFEQDVTKALFVCNFVGTSENPSESYVDAETIDSSLNVAHGCGVRLVYASRVSGNITHVVDVSYFKDANVIKMESGRRGIAGDANSGNRCMCVNENAKFTSISGLHLFAKSGNYIAAGSTVTMYAIK